MPARSKETPAGHIAMDAILDEGRNMRLKPDAGLAASMERFGLLEPIVVVEEPMDAGGMAYRLVAGARRLAAAKKLGWETIPAHLLDLPDEDMAAAAFAENDHRAGLSHVEEAYAVRDMMAEGWAVDAVAKYFGKSDRWVTDRVALMRVPEPVLKLVHVNAIPLNTALALLRCPDQKLMREVLEETEGERPEDRASEIVAHVHQIVEGANRLWPKIFGDDKACEVCLRRSGNMPTLFEPDTSYYGHDPEDVLIGAENRGGEHDTAICYDPKCYRKKVKAAAEGMKATAKEQGLLVVTKTEGGLDTDYPALDAVLSHEFPACVECEKKGIVAETGDVVCTDRECFKRLCTNAAQKGRREAQQKHEEKHGPKDPFTHTNRHDVHELELSWVLEQVKPKLETRAGADVREALVVAAAISFLTSAYDAEDLKAVGLSDKVNLVAVLLAMKPADVDAVKVALANRAVDRRKDDWNYAAAVSLGIDRHDAYEINEELFSKVPFTKAAILAMAAEANIELKPTLRKDELVGELLNKWPKGQLPVIVSEDFREHAQYARDVLKPKAKSKPKPKKKAKKKKG